MKIEFEATVGQAVWHPPSIHTILVLNAPVELDVFKPTFGWPIHLFILGDVRAENPIGTTYKITLEKQ